MPLLSKPPTKCTNDAEMIATLKSIETHLFHVNVRLHEINETLMYLISNVRLTQQSFAAALIEFLSQSGLK